MKRKINQYLAIIKNICSTIYLILSAENSSCLKTTFACLLLIVVSLKQISCFAQFASDFKPLATYSSSDKNLIQRLELQIEEEIGQTHSRKANEIKSLYRLIGLQMRTMVKKREFIKNDSLQWFIESIVQKLV